MKHLVLGVALLLASCTATKPPTPPPAAEPVGLDSPPLAGDSLAQAPVKLQLHAADSGSTPQQVVRRRLFGLLPAKHITSVSQHITSAASNMPQVPRKCKGCTFNVVAGNQTVAGKKATVAAGEGATASVVGKKAGPAIVASDSATANSVAGPGNIQATNGNGNAPVLTAPVQQPPDWRAALAKPVGYALATVGTVLVVGGAICFIAAYRRRKNPLA